MNNNSARDNAIYVLRIMNSINRLGRLDDRSIAVDRWLDLRARYNYKMTVHEDFAGLKDEDPKLYEELEFIDARWHDGAYDKLIERNFVY